MGGGWQVKRRRKSIWSPPWETPACSFHVGRFIHMSLVGTCVSSKEAASPWPTLAAPPTPLPFCLMPFKRSSHFPMQNLTPHHGFCILLCETQPDLRPLTSVQQRGLKGTQRLHFICFSFSPLSLLRCYMILKVTQLGKTLTLKQKEGRKGRGATSLLFRAWGGLCNS